VVEQGTHKPLVGSSNLPVTTKFPQDISTESFIMDKKALKDEYKQRKITGGIYRVTNTHSGKCLLGYAPDAQAKQNAFSFAVSTDLFFDQRLRQDWGESGGKVFTFEILETLVKKTDQTQEQFIADLQELEQMWSDKLDLVNRY
jgi:hypothetical protein